jgi:hypothetical protein
MIGILLTVYAGLEHAFEVDHLLAVNSLVTNRNKIKEAVKLVSKLFIYLILT